ncbi:MAG: GFA family protein [Deltaproteobacteria bacterium]|nr:GFA family protein [Deltaproteobacteria bacterium]
MANAKHHGSCHCGAVSYEVELDLAQPAISCNCSMCGRSGALLMFVPPDKFNLEKGEDAMSVYKFNKHVIDHLFCKTCGVRPFARGQGPKGPMVAINVRCLDDVDVFKQPRNEFDGKSR